MTHRLFRWPVIAAMVALLVYTCSSGQVMAQSDQRIAAIVNEDIVSNQDLVERITAALVFSGLPGDEASRRQVAPQVLQRIVDENLQLQEAERLGVRVSENEIAAALTDIARPSNMTAQELLTALAAEGISAETLREQTRAELAWVKIVRQVLRPSVVVSEAQLDMAMAADLTVGAEEYLLSEIVLPIYAAGEEEAVRENAIELRDAIRDGADFGNLARQFSVSAAAAEGGDIGWLALERLSPALQPAVAGLGPGQLSDPVRSPAGIHLILMRDKRKPQTGAEDINSRRLAQLFFPFGAEGVAIADQLELEAANLRQRLGSCADIVSAANQLALPASGDLGWIVPAEMPAELGTVVSNLSLGEISAPVRSANGVHLIGVCQLGGDGSASQAGRDNLRQSLERGQIERLATRYLRDLRKDAFIDVRVRF